MQHLTKAFREFLLSELPDLDRHLARRDVPVSRRPWISATAFVEFFVEGPDGNLSETYLDEPWFTDIYRLVVSWFADRYGDALRSDGSDSAPGFLLIFETPFRFLIPLTFVTPGPEEHVVGVNFPTTVQVHESPLDWLVAPPNLSAMSERSRSRAEAAVRDLATRTRKINMYLATARLPSSEASELRSSILSHLGTAVDGACGDQADRRSLAVWDFHLAVEKILKLRILQAGHSVPNTHSLTELVSTGVRVGLPMPTERSVSSLPGDKLAIRHRYLELEPPKARALWTVYDRTLAILLDSAQALERDFMSNDAVIYVRRLSVTPPSPPPSAT